AEKACYLDGRARRQVSAEPSRAHVRKRGEILERREVRGDSDDIGERSPVGRECVLDSFKAPVRLL
ncbi:MAG: hypothetical protein M3123_05170, partial [Actinomycetota bacterium]|nr:hypothetical protein [Actinomycetota bacterium]